MVTRRMGQILGEIASLNDHDVEEVLQEQKVTHQRFGEAALALGLVQPQQVWHAWLQQLRAGQCRVDLAKVGVDAQASQFLPLVDAVRLNIVPVRAVGDDLILAVTAIPDESTINYLKARTGKQLAFGLATAAEIEHAIASSYSGTKSVAASSVMAA